MLKEKIAAIILLSLVLITSCENKKDKEINQLNQLEKAFINEYTEKLIRYIGRKPEDASHENKFHNYFDAHYKNQAKQHELTAYYAENESKSFFLFTRIAPSVELKKVAIGGYVEFDKDNQVKTIEEVFRTWKQIPDTIEKRSMILFNKMIKGESLDPFYTENSGNMDYIEFPSTEVWYDKKKQRWVSSREDVLAEFIESKIKQTEEKIRELDKSKNTDSIK